jgi:predicted O-methyltransferase YrrM
MSINLHQAKHFLLHYFTARRKGHGAHSPFLYKLCEEVFYNPAQFYEFNRLSRTRNHLLDTTQSLDIVDLGAGSHVLPRGKRTIRDIAEHGISSSHQSEILCRLINMLGCNTCVELGTSLGLNAMYMAAAGSDTRVITIEGSPMLYDFASRMASKNGFKNIRFHNGPFDELLPGILKETGMLDLLFVDGNHTYEATRRYFEMGLAKKHNDTVFVFDDIYWSPGMTRAWKEIADHPEVTLSIDTFYRGYIFFRKEIREKVKARIYVSR